MGARSRPDESAATRGGTASQTGQRAEDGTTGARGAGRGGRAVDPRNRLGWIGLAVAGLLTAWQIVYAITAPSVSNTEAYESVGLLLTLVLSVGAMVLGIVALGQRVMPRWPAVAALAVGSYAFVVAVAGWIGRLMY